MPNERTAHLTRRTRPAGPSPHASAGRSGTGDAIRIVLAEEQRLVRESVRCLLEKEGDLEVVGETADGLKVLDLVRRLHPDVLVLAVGLPGLNGLEVTRQVHDDVPGVAIVVLSMYVNERYVLDALRNGAAAYVVKQTRSAELVRAIRAAVAGRRYLSSPFSDVRVDAWLERARTVTHDPYERLTSREREVLQLVVEGHSSARIASRLAISPRTAESHRASVMRKLGLTNQVDLIRYALARGILPLPRDPLDVSGNHPPSTN